MRDATKVRSPIPGALGPGGRAKPSKNKFTPNKRLALPPKDPISGLGVSVSKGFTF